MFDRIYQYFLREPRRLIGLGKNLVLTSAFILLIGAIGNVATGVGSITQGMGKQVVATRALAELYPSIPTWWVPESIVGCLPAIVLMVFGLSIASLGKRLKNAHF
ncbi:hypothetical protein [Variovorax paradoxus]|uniref:hypothetical protein n=1 Tax=Variovorax paradoxus TaxID=34073 RepID=UPI0019326297|nr:hypothetical protein INQ48_35620 [Variovorax paradoxus]